VQVIWPSQLGVHCNNPKASPTRCWYSYSTGCKVHPLHHMYMCICDCVLFDMYMLPNFWSYCGFFHFFFELPQLFDHWLTKLLVIWTVAMTALLEYFMFYLSKALYVIEWTLIILTFWLSEHTKGPATEGPLHLLCSSYQSLALKKCAIFYCKVWYCKLAKLLLTWPTKLVSHYNLLNDAKCFYIRGGIRYTVISYHL